MNDRIGMIQPSADEFVEPAISLVQSWLERAEALESRNDRATTKRLGDLVADDAGVDFVMAFVDRVARPDDHRVAAGQLSALVAGAPLPAFLSNFDRLLLRVGARLAPRLPSVVMPLAARRMRSIVGHLVAPAEPAALADHLRTQRTGGYDLNVNLLGEAVLGEREADARLQRLLALLEVPGVDYVSVKLSAVASQINHWAYDSSLERVGERLGVLVDAAASMSPPTFVNFDMEEYHDLALTVEAFKTVLSDPKRQNIDAGIVLQAYLPDVFDHLQDLVAWAGERHRLGGGTIKIRLVKGANLAMERVDAAMHGWEQAPFATKLETDASYRRCLDWVLTPDHLSGVRIGVASHNLFDVALAKLLADGRGVGDRVQFEMLQGMASGQAKAVNETAGQGPGSPMLLYTPAVGDDDFDVAIGYLFRRLEENASPDNFMRALFDLRPGSSRFTAEADFFRQGVALRDRVPTGPRRRQDRSRPVEPWPADAPFRNEPDTDPSLEANRKWIVDIAAATPWSCATPVTTSATEVADRVATGRLAGPRWAAQDRAQRRAILLRVGDELAKRRGELITTMMHEASKAFAEADVEVSEAIDFARWYADRCLDPDRVAGADFQPLGLMAVVPPWNFPTAIPAGGVLASLAAGNAVIFKPAPETPCCAELVAEACWAAGVPRDVLQFVRTPDDHVGRLLIESVDGVILTGSSDTAELFRSWKPRLRLFAETSGKNALIITPNADVDLAVQDLVRSAFGHAGQKCSAASLAILVGDVYRSPRFRRQLIDAVESLTVGSALNLGTDIAPLVGGVNPRLARAAANLEPGERWLVEPSISDGGLMTPGVRDGVRVDSWFHRTECFGPVLGLMAAADLDEALSIANSSSFGLTGGIHTLDPTEIQTWLERIEVGNGYVNRPITGAIVRRQPFGGWKRSSVGPGAKAGGPNYVLQLGRWRATTPSHPGDPGDPGPSAAATTDDYRQQWADHFAVDHDDSGLFCEANIFRYRPLEAIGLHLGPSADPGDVALVRKAAEVAGVVVHTVEPGADPDLAWLSDMAARGIERVRLVGVEPTDAMAAEAATLGIHLIDQPVTAAGRIELQHYVREQAMSITLHRFGNLARTTIGTGSPAQSA